MKNPGRTAFLAAMAAALGLPLLGWTGLRGFVGVHGFDTPDVKPRLTARDFFSGRFRRDFEAHWSHVFFGRTEMLFAKNGLFDLFNFGAFHAGYAGRIIQGRHGQLFEKPYIDVASAPSLPIESPLLQGRSRTAIRRFGAAVSSLGPDAPAVAFLLAPSKAETFRDFLPASRKRLLRGRPGSPYDAWRRILGECGVPFFEAASLFPPGVGGEPAEPDSPALFPATGTHWTVHWAAHAVVRLLAAATPDLPRPVPLAPVFAKDEPFTADDQDMARLLNLPWPYRRGDGLYACPRFAAPVPGRVPAPRVLLLGDSFSVQVRDALVLSGAFPEDRVSLVYNDTPGAAAFREALAAADIVVFTYSAPSLASTRVAATLETLANHVRPAAHAGRKYALGRSPYLGAGDWGEEDGGRVVTLAPGGSGSLVLPLPASSVPAGEDIVLRLFLAGPQDRPLRLSVQADKDVEFALEIPAGSEGPVEIPLVRRDARSGPAVRYPTLRVDPGSGSALRAAAFSLVAAELRP